MKKIINNLYNLDLWIVMPYLILCTTGIIMVYSASSNLGSSPLKFMLKQLIYVIIGIILLVGCSHIRIHKLMNRTVIGCFSALFLIAFFALKFFGQSINGAAGWFTIAGFSLQPSEFSKLFLIIYISNELSKNYKYLIDDNGGLHRFHWLTFWRHRSTKEWAKSMLPPIVYSIVIVGFIYVQPDLGGSIINAAIVIVLIMASGAFNWKQAVGTSCVCIVGLLSFVSFYYIPKALSPAGQNNYQYQRIVAWLQPFQHAQDVGKQLVNSFYAQSNGGVFGVGLGNSVEKTGYLPEPNTDFIMAVIAEELGLIAIIIIMVLLGIIVARTVLIGIRDHDAYYSLICYGVATYMTVEMLFNMGGVVGLLPITGVTFPFISYGGSSMITLSAALGLVLNIDRTQRRRQFAVQVKES
ncbi:FtsW/RodA/SpoVE family cell cycle protein [Acetilactobacillus jinshanensis]|uniref:Probable peptidoglycan glycosyltransferase FtsW n=1 Tax=Acetilactobacillus jinshanensis TaxID=1720083 RepID=A0A4V1ALK5_9LACO|nr:FtsW/RodA/SpoVE family cell cycle protein [Acetilactobacillus jinshanensis]QBP17919.1 FtsW/RodA/SpoVE family cell cycle protein [Acetilactobacillus jinshanensis]URL60782.1 FtsW/RodA/SpoVE family cell cycle protein [uncultured bacterium]